MGALSRFAVATLVLAAAAVAVALVVGTRAPTRSVTPAAPLAARASFDPAVVGFGDRVIAEVVVLLDRRALDASHLRVEESLGPLQPLAPLHVTRTTRGRLLTVTYQTPVVCLDDRCLAPRGAKRLRLPPVRVAVPRRAGGTASAVAAWPVVDVRGRVTAADLAPASPRLRSDVAPTPVSYRIAPSTLATVLEILAAALATAGIALAGRQAWALRRTRRQRLAPLSEIERALALARDAEARPPADRRRALGLLARLLARRDDRLAGAARSLAWSEPPPTTSDVAELVTRVEREVNGGDR